MKQVLWCLTCIERATSAGATWVDLKFYEGGTLETPTTLYAGSGRAEIRRAVTMRSGDAVCWEHI